MASRRYSSGTRTNRVNVDALVGKMVGEVGTAVRETIVEGLFTEDETRQADGKSPVNAAIAEHLLDKMNKDVQREFQRVYPSAVRNIIRGSYRTPGYRTMSDDFTGASGQAAEDFQEEYKAAMKRYEQAFRLSDMAMRMRSWLRSRGYQGTRDYWNSREGSRKSRLRATADALGKMRYGFQTGGVSDYYREHIEAGVNASWQNPEGKSRSRTAIRRNLTKRINTSRVGALSPMDFSDNFGNLGQDTTPDVRFSGYWQMPAIKDVSVQIMHKRFKRNPNAFPLYNSALAEAALQVSIVRGLLKDMP